MKVKANVSFCGEVSMYKGEVREISNSLANPLLKCGYVTKIQKNKKNKNEVNKNED